MVIELKLQLWHIVSMVAGFGGFLLAMGRFFFTYLDKRIEAMTTLLGDKMEKQSHDMRKLERDLLEFKAQLPDKYVRREDFIRSEAVIEAKLDGLAVKFDNMILGGNRGR